MSEDEAIKESEKVSDNYIQSELVIGEKGNMIVDYKPPYRKEVKDERRNNESRSIQ